MKKQDKIKLDSISNIDEGIIDAVTDKKIALASKLGAKVINPRKKLIAIASLAASLALMLSLLLVVIIPIFTPTVPIYRGMSIRRDVEAPMAAQDLAPVSATTILRGTSGNAAVPLSGSAAPGFGGGEGHKKDDHGGHDEHLDQNIEEMVTINVITDDQVKYYVEPGETFIIEVHIDNPRDYEIQSFTLNGKKYANYMFKEGSTMELLLLEVTAPTEPGYTEYTIDAIKYIDGTEIKDVDMSSADKSIKAGITYPAAPSATVTAQTVLPTSIELAVHVSDPYALIGTNELAVYLTDGDKVVASQPLKVGENRVTFDNLIMCRTYQYGIVTAFDLVDGREVHQEWLLTNKLTTAGAFSIVNATPTQESITFEVQKIGEVGEITSVSLYDAATDLLVEMGNADTRAFDGLLSDHTYNLYVDFTYTVNGETVSDWVAIKGIKTIAKTAPVLTFGEVTSDQTSVTYDVSASDPDGLLHVMSVEILKDGQALKDNGTTLNGKFEALLSNNAYTVKVTYTYDLNDGQGVHTETVTKDITTVAKTAPVLTFGDGAVDQTSVTYDASASDPDGLLHVTSVEILKDGQAVKNNGTALNGKFEALLSNNAYTVKVTYTYDLNDGQGVHTETVTKDITTVAKTAPTITFGEFSITDISVAGSYSMADPDAIGSVTSVEVRKNGTAVQSNAQYEIAFDGLEYYTDYSIAVTYTFNLNDGAGLRTQTATYDFNTAPHLVFESCKIANATAVSEGETIYLQIALNNPSGALPESVEINGRSYRCTSATTATKIFANIVYDGQFEGGDTLLTVEKVHMTLDGKSYSIEPTENNSASIFINSKLEVKEIELVAKEGESYVEKEYFVTSISREDMSGSYFHNVYVRIYLSNKAGYTVDSITVTANNGSYPLEGDSLIKINDECYVMRVSGGSLHAFTSVFITNITYHNEYINKSADVSGVSSKFAYFLPYCDIKEIRTADDLLAMQRDMYSPYYYILQNDIDLEGRNWVGNEFNGIFDGNGYTIKNMTYTGKATGNLGLFSQGSGVIQNLTLASVLFLAEYDEDAYNMAYNMAVGGFCGAGTINFINCTIDEESFISASGADDIGGFVGSGGRRFVNCTNHATVTGDGGCVGGFVGGISYDSAFESCTNTGAVSGGGTYVGGIVGMADNGSFENCTNTGAVSGNTYRSDAYAGGIVGNADNVSFENCTNTGTVNSGSAGGLAGMTYDAAFESCTNTGAVSGGGMHVGGIVGMANNVSFENCTNTGAVSGNTYDTYAGGIVGEAYYDTNFKNCVNTCAVLGAGYIGGIVGQAHYDTNFENCINITSNVQRISGIGGTITNSYVLGKDVTVEQLNSKSFYLETLGWSEEIWNLDDLDIENGKYPTLKP